MGKRSGNGNHSRKLRSEQLEDRRLLASDISAGLEIDVAHGAGCGCAACSSGCSTEFLAAELPEGHYIGDGHDHGEMITDQFGSYFFDPAPELGDVPQEEDPASGFGDPTIQHTLPILHSNPTASRKIFLDFDGHNVSGTAWNQFNNNQTIHAPPYSIDGDLQNFSSGELQRIVDTFERVAEDFAPFNVDVTTEDPGEALFRQGGQAIRVLISTDRDEAAVGGTGNRWYENAGGVAYLNSWNWNSDTPVWVFENNLGTNAKNLAEAASHEAGHAFGLRHDGDNTTSYYQGHGSGATGWAPIMGVGYNRNLTQWSRGDYSNGNNSENDINRIVGRLQYRADDHSNSTTDFGTATPLITSGLSNVEVEGIIERSTDVDVFTFDAVGETIVDLDFDPARVGPNLDIEVTIYDDSGSVVTTLNPAGGLNARWNTTLNGGSYLLKIDGVGRGTAADGYTDYGSLGGYSITGTIESSDPIAGGPVVVSTPVLNSVSAPTDVTFTFNQPIDRSTFTVADVVSFTDPSGNRLTMTGYNFPAPDQARITFNQLTTEGAYSMEIGPEIYDIEGLAMDQNQNGIAGEPTDTYSFSFDVFPDSRPGEAPYVTSTTPTVDDVTGPTSMSIQFDQRMDPTSFDPAMDVVTFQSPNGSNISAEITGYSFPTEDTLQVEFNQQTALGTYIMILGPGITDLEGLAMDQNRDGVAGSFGDTFTAVFTVTEDAGLRGDFDNDMDVDADDIDLLSLAIATGNTSGDYDLTGDGSVDSDDKDELILNVIGTLYGDANLDFVVDTSDFNIWNENKFTTGTGWAAGDFSGDQATDVGDFNFWNENKFRSANRPANAFVPQAVDRDQAVGFEENTDRIWALFG